MPYGKPKADAEVPLNTRVHEIYGRVTKCNNIAEVADLVGKVTDEELLALRTSYSVARPGRSARERAFFYGLKSSIDAEVRSRKLNTRRLIEQVA